jgi:hypothetical protein
MYKPLDRNGTNAIASALDLDDPMPKPEFG